MGDGLETGWMMDILASEKNKNEAEVKVRETLQV